MSLREVLASGAKVSPPGWLAASVCYETKMGSVAYGVAAESSDVDVYGICVPPKEIVFPHLAGEIFGFGAQVKRFETWQEHHVAALDQQWDFLIFGLVKFCQLAMENNPNVLEALFTPAECVLTSSEIGAYLRAHRTDFLHKGAWHKFKGYAYSQLSKLKGKVPTGKRAELAEAYGYDVKLGYHVVRLYLEVEQILKERELDLGKHQDLLREIRGGAWPRERLEEWARDKERELEAVYEASTVPHGPDEAQLKRHLVHCLELHYGDLRSLGAVVL
ncbi:MAG: nucleotidyltransferase domain-containing protein [Kofleriaceae bacterium]